MKRGVTLIVFGLAGILTAGIWYWTSRPSDKAVRTAEVLRRTAPGADVAGPIILAVAGAFTLLLGVILYATAQPSIPTAPNLMHPHRPPQGIQQTPPPTR